MRPAHREMTWNELPDRPLPECLRCGNQGDKRYNPSTIFVDYLPMQRSPANEILVFKPGIASHFQNLSWRKNSWPLLYRRCRIRSTHWNRTSMPKQWKSITTSTMELMSPI